MFEPTQFGNKKALFLKDVPNNKKRQNVLNELRKLDCISKWESAHNRLTFNTIEHFKSNPYLIRYIPEYTDKYGKTNICQEYFFFLTKIENIKLCFLVEKKKPLDKAKIYQMRFRFTEELFDNTLMTGYFILTENKKPEERVEISSYFCSIFPDMGREISSIKKEPKQQYIFLLNDMWYNMNKETSLILSQRLVRIQEIIARKWYPDIKTDNFKFKVQNYFNYQNIYNFLKNERKYFYYKINDSQVTFMLSKSHPYENNYRIHFKRKLPKKKDDDVSFKNGEWVINNSNYNLKKKKKDNFIVKKSQYPDVYWLFKNNKKIDKPALIQTEEDSKKLRELFKSNKSHRIKCVWNNDFQKWKPIL